MDRIQQPDGEQDPEGTGTDPVVEEKSFTPFQIRRYGSSGSHAYQPADKRAMFQMAVHDESTKKDIPVGFVKKVVKKKKRTKLY